jgi:nitric oxide reductase NorQ protein
MTSTAEFVAGKLSEPAYANIRDHKQIFEDLPALLIGVTGGVYNEELEKLLDKYTPAAGTVRGRAGSGNGGPETVAQAPVLTASETKYQRPNGDWYIPRKWGEHTDVEVLKKARDLDQYILLYGPPGTGKTALAEAAFNTDLEVIIGTGDIEVADFIGQWITTPEGGFEWIDGPLVRAAEGGYPILIDEIGLIDPKVLSLAYGLMDGRRELVITANPKRGIVKAKKGFYVIAATNPKAPGVILSEALISRFPIQAEMTTDWKLAQKLGVPKDMVTAAQNLDKREDVQWAPQMRELLAFRDVEKAFGTTWAIRNLIAGSPEMDRVTVSDVIGQVYGETMLPARI